MWNRADDVHIGSGRAREDELSVPQIGRDVRSVDRRPLDSPTPPGEGRAEVDAACDDGTPRELGSEGQTHEALSAEGIRSGPLPDE